MSKTPHDGSSLTRMLITPDGLVQIGSTQQFQVDQSGNVTTTGSIQFSGTLMPNGVHGTTGQVLTSQGSGTPIWADGGGGASGWALTGNAGTTYKTNYIGTSDAQDLQIRVRNAQSGVIEGGGTLNTGLGYQVFLNNTTGAGNVALGYQALATNTSGAANTATGYQALLLNSGGAKNTATGHYAL